MMSHNEKSDADDVRLAVEGDREAFGRLYDRHARAVRAVVAAVSGDFGAVEDLTQEAFLRGYTRISTLRDSGGFGRWIQGVARMVAREWRRKVSRDLHQFEPDRNQLAPDINVHDVIALDEKKRRVLSAVVDLPERERLAVHAYFFEEQSGDQAAAIIGISRSGFYAALERGLNRLRKRLGIVSPTVRRGP